MSYKVGVCGYYAEGLKDYGGQPVKTRILISELENILGKSNVKTVDTLKWKKKIITLLYECFKLAQSCENIIILPAANGVRVFVPLFLFLNIFFKRKLHYVVIGGWLTNLLVSNKRLLEQVKKLDGVYVETHFMQTELEKCGLKNIYFMPNMKDLKVANISESNYSTDSNKKFCTFSRIVKNKGIEDAIKAVIQINQESNCIICKLDIYGHIYEDYEDEFNNILSKSPSYIEYKGLAKPDESVQILKNYYMQLFPTKYKTEGVPGSIIDSYFAGLPVLASKWDSFSDVIDDGITGIGFEIGNYEDLVDKMRWCINRPELVNKMKYECIKKSEEYGTNEVMKNFISHLK